MSVISCGYDGGMTLTPIKTNIDNLIAHTAKELNSALQDYQKNRTNESLQRMRELRIALEGALELAESYNNTNNK